MHKRLGSILFLPCLITPISAITTQRKSERRCGASSKTRSPHEAVSATIACMSTQRW